MILAYCAILKQRWGEGEEGVGVGLQRKEGRKEGEKEEKSKRGKEDYFWRTRATIKCPRKRKNGKNNLPFVIVFM